MTSNEDIKQAAFRIFAHQGYECTSMQDIAQAVGLKKQSLYSHFSSKQELYESILIEQTKIIMSEIYTTVERLKDLPTDVLLKGIFECLVDIFICKERLLLWKRGFLMNRRSELQTGTDWHSDDRLRAFIFEIISKKHTQLKDYESFCSFMLSFMLFIQGYFDYMVIKGHDKAVFDMFWTNIWNGIGRHIS